MKFLIGGVLAFRNKFLVTKTDWLKNISYLFFISRFSIDDAPLNLSII